MTSSLFQKEKRIKRGLFEQPCVQMLYLKQLKQLAVIVSCEKIVIVLFVAWLIMNSDNGLVICSSYYSVILVQLITNGKVFPLFYALVLYYVKILQRQYFCHNRNRRMYYLLRVCQLHVAQLMTLPINLVEWLL